MTTREASEASRSDETPKSGTPEQWARLEQYRTTVSRGGGLTLHGWDDFDRLERHLDRPAYEARMEEGRRRSRMETARELSIADLRTIIAEKEPLAQFALEQVAIRMQMRVDAITERGGETVGISLGFAREIVRAINAVCSVSDGDPEGRDLGLGAKPASAVGSGADETPENPREECLHGEAQSLDLQGNCGRGTPHPHPPTDKGVESLIERLTWGSVAVGTDGQWVSIRREVRDEAATALERLTRELDDFALFHRAEIGRLIGEKEDLHEEQLEALARAEAAEAQVERLTRERDEARGQIRETWVELEECGAPPERFGWPFKEPKLSEALSSFVNDLIQAREDLLARAEASEAREASLKAGNAALARGNVELLAEIASLKAALEEKNKALEASHEIIRAYEDARRAGTIPDWVRPEVRAFAVLMEQQLRANDHKPGWKNDTPAALMDRMHEETTELIEALGWGHPNEIAKEAADVANSALMIADVRGCLGEKA